MNPNWPTKEKDLQTAQAIMEEYANEKNRDTLSFFEIEVDRTEKKMNFCLSGWIHQLIEHFISLYGFQQGDFITRQVLTCCITRGQTLH